MADVILKVKVLQDFKDTETGEPRSPDDVLDMTPDRYAEAVARLARWPGKFLEVIAATGADVQTPAPQPPMSNPRVAELQAVADRLAIDKPASQMKTDELEAVAQALGIDLSACKNNPERAAAIHAWVEAYVKE